MTIYGYVHKYGDSVNTDLIIPARYLNTTSKAELAMHCMEDIDTEFSSNAKPGDIIVAGENFGCGSSREHAPIAIKSAGISCVVAKSFARIFYRNAINIGLPIVECPQAIDEINIGDILSINLKAGAIENITQSKTYKISPYPEFIDNIISKGGVINLFSHSSENSENDII